ncbi:hypothetical protein [Kytococcus sedentarius]|uniref:hypothetical protein n=1 Tax=Kytococcus sedentarius TaxID=1276 RepID=UPI001950A709|nr:hypothetical protein [Kytococcus sedentarius]QRO87248.1 hypothetical protein I6J30_10630 [Kytococcus sedentarius]
MTTRINRRLVLAVGVGSIFTTWVPAGAVVATPTAGDMELDDLIADLERLPAWLKRADPKETPHYEQRLNRALNGRRVIDGPSLTSRNIARPAGGWRCSLEVAKVIAEYGVPIFKVLAWIRKARQIWGGFTGIWRAIRSGAAAAQIGPEAAAVLEGILGYVGIKDHCF